ncbi:MAG TPA: hypothetical protein VJT84_14460 [Gaiellaceae bacterium]|nr:hypothetical protein [Gaiellaceae bacterium]
MTTRTRNRRLRRRLVFAAAALLAFLALPIAGSSVTGAPATFPGEAGKIAFVFAESQIYTIDPDGTHRHRLTNDYLTKIYPSWSPDGREIVYSAAGSGTYDLFVMDADGRHKRRLTRGGPDDLLAQWSPDGTRLLVTAQKPDGTMVVDVLDATGRNRRPLTSMTGARGISWSPSGTTIAFMVDRRIYLMDLGTRRTRVLPLAVKPVAILEWLPDARGLVVLAASGEIAAIGLDGAVRTVLLEPRNFGDFSLSPDQRRVVFTAPVPAGNAEVSVLYVADPGGRNPIPINGLRNGVLDTPWDSEMTDWQPLCTLSGTDGPDTLTGTPGGDKICGLGGDDVIRGGGGDDIILGGDGRDTLDGGSGDDWLFGAAGDDTIAARYGGRDIVDGGPGFDVSVVDSRMDTVTDVERRRLH